MICLRTIRSNLIPMESTNRFRTHLFFRIRSRQALAKEFIELRSDVRLYRSEPVSDLSFGSPRYRQERQFARPASSFEVSRNCSLLRLSTARGRAHVPLCDEPIGWKPAVQMTGGRSVLIVHKPPHNGPKLLNVEERVLDFKRIEGPFDQIHTRRLKQNLAARVSCAGPIPYSDRARARQACGCKDTRDQLASVLECKGKTPPACPRRIRPGPGRQSCLRLQTSGGATTQHREIPRFPAVKQLRLRTQGEFQVGGSEEKKAPFASQTGVLIVEDDCHI